ncbi:hypothetical protein WCO_01760, partial [Escherichia sp. KTE11]
MLDALTFDAGSTLTPDYMLRKRRPVDGDEI